MKILINLDPYILEKVQEKADKENRSRKNMIENMIINGMVG